MSNPLVDVERVIVYIDDLKKKKTKRRGKKK